LRQSCKAEVHWTAINRLIIGIGFCRRLPHQPTLATNANWQASRKVTLTAMPLPSRRNFLFGFFARIDPYWIRKSSSVRG